MDPSQPIHSPRITHRRTAHLMILLIATALLSACAIDDSTSVKAATQSATRPQTSREKMWALLRVDDRPLSAVVLMEKMVREKELNAQVFAQFYAITGDEQGTLEIIDADAKPSTSPATPLDAYTQRDALDAIAAAAQGTRIVILNEYHHIQRHRAFALQVAWRLRKEGFTTFAAETFNTDVEKTLVNGIPVLNTGGYSIDPPFGDLIRQSLRAGYRIFDYEDRDEHEGADQRDYRQGIALREQAQADNIKRWLDKNPDARVFIYVGGSHGAETPDEAGNEWMASRLKKMTGIDPLTLSQVSGGARPEYDGPTMRAATALGAKKPFVLIDKSGAPMSRFGYDMLVFHPRVADRYGRPGWLAMDGYRQPVPVTLSPMPGRTLLRAYVMDEPAGRIAMDQVLVPPNATSATLMLPKGKYSLVVQDEAGVNQDLRNVSVLDPR